MKPRFITPGFRNQAFGASLVTAIVVCLSGAAMAQTSNFWTGTTSTAWNNDANWSAGVVPTKAGNYHAVVNTTTPNIATITVGIIAPVDIIVGSGAGANGRVDHLGGDASTGIFNWMFVGRNGGTGVYNLGNPAGTSGTFTGIDSGSGTLTVNAARLYIGGFEGSGSTGTVNVNTSGSLLVGDQLQVGTNNSVGTLNFDNGTINTNGWTEIGNGGGSTGHFRMSNGTLNKQGNDHFAVGANGATGNATIQGGTININNELWVGNNGANGTLNISGGILDVGSWASVGRSGGTGTLNLSGTGQILTGPDGEAFIVGDNSNSTGTMVQTGGTLTVDNQFWVGSGNGTTNGDYTMSGGELNVNNWIAIGRGGFGEFNMSGGTFTKTGGGTAFIVGSSGTGTFTQTGGLVQVLEGETWMGENGSGSYTLDGPSAEFTTGFFQVARGGTSTFTVNLNEGVLEVDQIAGGSGNATVNFDGAQIFARSSQASFIGGLDTANIAAGGLLLDDIGVNLTVPQLLSGTGGLVKDGSGTLTLTGANSYAGATTVNNGGLVITTASTAGGALTLADFTSLGVNQTTANQATTVASVTLGSASDTELNFDLGSFAGNTTNAPVNVNGAMNVNGTVTVNVADSLPVVGTFPLISYVSKTGSGSFATGSLPDGVDATVSETAGLVSLNVTRVNDPYWTGAIDNIWNKDPGGTANWMDDYAEAATTFADGDPALFDDRVGAGPTNVVLNTTVAPGDSGVTFNNSTVNYTLSGTGKITGTTGLTKSGTGTTTISIANNDYTGVTTLSGGILSVPMLTNGGVASPIGAADAFEDKLVFNGGTLYYTGGSTSIDRSFVTTAPGGGIGTDNNLTITGFAESDGGGNFLKSGPGNLIMAYDGSNFFGGGAIDGINVLAGTLTFDGTGVFQSNNVTGDIWVGTTLTSGANLVLDDTEMTSADNYLAIARGSGTTGLVSTCTLTNSTLSTGNLSLAYDNGVVGYSSTAILTLNDSTYTLPTGFNRLGESAGGTGTVVLNGASSMTVGATNIGQNSGANGTLNIKGTSLYTSNNRVQVGSNAGSTGNLIIEDSGSLVVTSYVSVGFNGGGSMTVKGNGSFSNNDDFSVNESGDVPASVTLQDNGTIDVTKVVYVGRNTGRVGTVTQTGGTFTGNGNEFQIGVLGQGTWLQSGGVTNAGGWTSIGRHGGSTGVVTVSGGTFNQTGTDRGLMIGEGGTGTLNIQGTGTVNSLGTVGVLVSNSASGVGTVNLDGGTLSALNVRDGGGNGTFHFNGGTLQAGTGAALNFMFGIDTVDVKAGGATVDSNGQTIALNQNLLDGTGGGGLTKIGTGFLQLNGANTYTGTTTVSAGSLGGTGSIAGPLNVTGTGTIAPGASAGTFTVVGNTTVAGTYACEIDGASADVLAVTGNLNITGASLNVNQLSAPVGSEFVIATYTGSLTGTFASVTGGTVSYATPGQIKVTVTAGSGYDTWASAKGLTGVNDGPTQDPENDGIENVLEFVLGGNPLASDPSILPDLSVTSTNFIFTFNRADESEAEVTLTFQHGSNLTGWTNVAIGADTGSSGAGVVVNEGTPVENPDVITVTIPKGANTKLFGRLNAVK